VGFESLPDSDIVLLQCTLQSLVRKDFVMETGIFEMTKPRGTILNLDGIAARLYGRHDDG
jgi:hypothetical protein